MKNIVLSPTTSSMVGLYGYGNASRAASQAWRSTDDQGFKVCERSEAQIPGEPPFRFQNSEVC